MFESTDWTFTENKNSDLIGTYVRPNQEEDLQMINYLLLLLDEEESFLCHLPCLLIFLDLLNMLHLLFVFPVL